MFFNKNENIFDICFVLAPAIRMLCARFPIRQLSAVKLSISISAKKILQLLKNAKEVHMLAQKGNFSCAKRSHCRRVALKHVCCVLFYFVLFFLVFSNWCEI